MNSDRSSPHSRASGCYQFCRLIAIASRSGSGTPVALSSLGPRRFVCRCTHCRPCADRMRESQSRPDSLRSSRAVCRHSGFRASNFRSRIGLATGFCLCLQCLWRRGVLVA
jgi:hypothetical protein